MTRHPPPQTVPEDEEMDIEDEEMDEDEDGLDMFQALGSMLATEDGDTVATALVSLKDATEKIAAQLEMQNKILVKIVSALAKPACTCQTVSST